MGLSLLVVSSVVVVVVSRVERMEAGMRVSEGGGSGRLRVLCVLQEVQVQGKW